MVAMCCEVALADGAVSTSEFEHILGVLCRLAGDAVGFSEIQEWLAHGPPRPDARLSDDRVKLFLREGVAVARADGRVDEAEVATMRDFVQRCFRLSKFPPRSA